MSCPPCLISTPALHGDAQNPRVITLEYFVITQEQSPKSNMSKSHTWCGYMLRPAQNRTVWGTWHRGQATHLPGQPVSSNAQSTPEQKRGWIEGSRNMHSALFLSCRNYQRLTRAPVFKRAPVSQLHVGLHAVVRAGCQRAADRFE